MSEAPHVVILGCGFGGVGVAQRLRDESVNITILDKQDYHTFQPLLYQVATDELEPTAVSYPIRDLLHRHSNISFHKCAVQGVDLANKRVSADGIPPLDYDYLVLALGSKVNFHGTPGAAEHSFPLYTMPDAIRLHDHIIRTLEDVDKNPRSVADGGLTFCVIGGGPTGTEVAGALTELLHTELRADYPNLPIDHARVILYERSPHLLGPFQPKLRDYAKQALEERGVEVVTNMGITEVGANDITLTTGEKVKTRTLVWAAGMQANPITETLGLELGPGGRIPVGPNLQLNTHPEVFAIGDMASATDANTGSPLPGLAAVALQQGRYVAETIVQLHAGKAIKPFEYYNKGTMAQVGRGAAVVELPMGGTLTGQLAWLAWLGVHLSLLNSAEEKTSVFVDWGWNLFTHKRGKRILLNDDEEDTP